MVGSLALALSLFATADIEKPARYPRPELLVEVANLVSGHDVILDARPREKYLAGHIPGALWVDQDAWKKAFTAQQDPGKWAKRIGSLGIRPENRVILYDDVASNDAARIWWILRYWGFKNAGLLNGGWQAWSVARGKVTQEETIPQPVPIELHPQSARLATKDQIVRSLDHPPFQIVDARSTPEFNGTTRTARRNGAIPGAKHCEWLQVIDRNTKRFKNPDELKKVFSESGIDLNRPSVTYCQSGGRAAVMAFALELMGAKGVRNYYRSWAEWGNAGDSPVKQPVSEK